MTRDDVFDAGWPGQKILEEAARIRVYVAIRTLRTLGLGDVLETGTQGYYLNPSIPIEAV